MIEAAMTISNNTIPIEIVEKIIQFEKELLQNQSFYLMVWKKL
jgi:putative hydrolase of the HAD superfamily